MGCKVLEILKSTRFCDLSEKLQKEIEELACDFSYEKTITPKTNLSFLLELCKTKIARKTKSARKLKQAEKMIMKIASLKYDELKERQERGKERERGGFKTVAMASDLSFLISDRIKQIFERLGIKDRRIMEDAVWSLGEKEIENRAEIIFSSTLEERIVRGIFDFNPKLIMEKFDVFVATIEMLETKKEMIDAWAREQNKALPLNYYEEPAVLFTDYIVLQKMLGEAEKTKPVITEEKTEYHAKPMRSEDLIKVLEKGFNCEVREGNHYIVLNPANRKTATISKSHKGQMELNKSVIKKIVEQQLKIDLGEFQKKREVLGL